MLSLLRDGNKFLIRFISVFILGVFLLKTGSLPFSIWGGKCWVAAGAALDAAEEAEQEEHKEGNKKNYSKLACLIVDAMPDMRIAEHYRKFSRGGYETPRVIEHFDTIPSPPPDQGF